MAKSLKKQFEELIAKLEPELQLAFLAAVDDLRAGVDMTALLRALKDNDVDGAVRALNIDPAVFTQYRQAATGAYAAGGALSSANIPSPPGQRVLFRFDVANPRAEAWIAENVASRITNLVEEQALSARVAILSGYSQGQHPDTIARELAGRLNRATGKREGGIVGLSAPQAEYVASMRARLASGDPAEMRKVLTMERRDKRYDALILRSIEAGTPVARADIDQMARRYADRLVALRAENIARTETGQAVMSARMESWRQGLGKTGYPEAAVTREWRHGAKLENARMQHVAMHGRKVQGLTDAFVLPDGTRMMHAMDPAGGAKHCASCRCDTRFSIDYSYGLT